MLNDNLIHMVNDLQDTLSVVKVSADISLPQIAVVGSQSSGKTSVLESLVGRDFLPRGAGIVTRCPLVLKLHQTRPGAGERQREWGEFGHKPGQQFEDFDAIRQEIEKQTVVLAGPKNVVTTPIMLSVYSPNVLTLTVIDLPGVVQTAIAGQSSSIVQEIENMVMQFIKPENTIILAITPANSDLANSAAINLARRVDPEFDRTIGVLTKLDIMDRGTNAIDILEGRALPLKRGWIGVVNRSQEDTNNRLPLLEARARESKYFRDHPIYSRVAERQGTAYLARTMSATLLHHIQRCLPDLFKRVDDYIKKTRAKQESLGLLDDTERNKEAQLIGLLHKYNEEVARMIEGGSRSMGEAGQTGELVGGARIDNIFQEHFAPYVRSMKAGDMLTDEKLRETTRNANGIQASLFPSDRSFTLLVKEQVRRLDAPGGQCVAYTHAELSRIAAGVSSQLFPRYPALRTGVDEITRRQLEDDRRLCAQHVRTVVEGEQAYVNVRHPGMVGAGDAATVSGVGGAAAPTPAAAVAGPPPPAAGGRAPPAAGAPPSAAPPAASAAAASRREFDVPHNMTLTGPLSDRERVEFTQLRRSVETYFGIVKETVVDQVPKAIVHLMVNKLLRDLHPTLMSNLYKPEQIEQLLEEAPGIAQQRVQLAQFMAALLKARDILNRVRETPTAAIA